MRERPGARLLLALGVATLPVAAAGLAACFPSYGFLGGDGGPAGDGAAGVDGTTGDAATGDGASGDAPGDGPTRDSGVPPGDSSASPDSTGPSDSAAPPLDGGGDSGPLANMATIPAGTYSFNVALDGGTILATATLDYTLAVDRDEVTIGRFDQWVSAGMPLPDAGTSLDPHGAYPSMVWDDASWRSFALSNDYKDPSSAGCGQNNGTVLVTYTTSNLSAHPDYPLNCATWMQAEAYCWFDGQKRLPTDTEWRVIATSEGRQMPYPWGSTLQTDCSYAVTSAATACAFPIGVGSATNGNTLDGVHDIIGSLQEWAWDLQFGSGYTYPVDAGRDYPGPNQGGVSASTNRVYIGDFYSSSDPTLLEDIQPGPTYGDPTNGYPDCGFRCVKSLP